MNKMLRHQKRGYVTRRYKRLQDSEREVKEVSYDLNVESNETRVFRHIGRSYVRCYVHSSIQQK